MLSVVILSVVLSYCYAGVVMLSATFLNVVAPLHSIISFEDFFSNLHHFPQCVCERERKREREGEREGERG